MKLPIDTGSFSNPTPRNCTMPFLRFFHTCTILTLAALSSLSLPLAVRRQRQKRSPNGGNDAPDLHYFNISALFHSPTPREAGGILRASGALRAEVSAALGRATASPYSALAGTCLRHALSRQCMPTPHAVALRAVGALYSARRTWERFFLVISAIRLTFVAV